MKGAALFLFCVYLLKKIGNFLNEVSSVIEADYAHPTIFFPLPWLQTRPYFPTSLEIKHSHVTV